MKLNSRSTLGLFIGGLQIFGFVAISIYVIVVLIRIKDLSAKDAQFRNDDVAQWYSTLLFIILMTCLIVTLTTVLLIIGIIQRRSRLMKPWIVVNMLGIGVTFIRILVVVVSGIVDSNGFGSIFGHTMLGILILGLQYVIFKNIYNLCQKIEEESEPLEQLT